MIGRRIFGRVLGLAAVSACLPGLARAQGPAASAGAAQPIAALNNGLVQVMKAGKATPFADRAAILKPIVEAAFDLPMILQNSVGPARWSGIPEAQKTELADVFNQFTVDSYVANFDSFSGETFVISPDQRHVGRDVVVQTRIVGTSGEPTRIDYVMRELNGGWRAVDILLDGSISRIAVTRSDFRSLLGTNDATALIASLRGKVAGLTAGVSP